MKGQWFIISAVIATGAFLTISLFLKQFFFVDHLATEKMNEDYYFNNIKEELDNVVKIYNCSNGELEKKLEENIVFAKKQVAEMGYYLFINYTIVNCVNDVADVRFGILLASENMMLYENVNPDDILPTS